MTSFTCLESTVETIEKGVKNVQSWQQKHQNDVNDVVSVFLLLIWTYFTPFSSTSIVDFEQLNVNSKCSIYDRYNPNQLPGFYMNIPCVLNGLIINPFIPRPKKVDLVQTLFTALHYVTKNNMKVS